MYLAESSYNKSLLLFVIKGKIGIFFHLIRLRIRLSIKEGLKSWDLEVLRRVRAMFKGKVTFTYKLVTPAPVRTEDEEFILEDINRAEVQKELQ